MELKDVQRLNEILQGQGSESVSSRLCVDTFRTPYLLWERPMSFPSLSVLHAEPESSARVLRQIVERSPELLGGGQVLPEARPRRDEPNLHIVRAYSCEEQQYLLKVKLLMTYMGGAAPSEIEDRTVQNRNPAFQSDRVYFQARLFPVKEIERHEGQIVDFEPEPYGPASGMKSMAGETHQTARWNVMLFDEMDFSELEAKIRTRVSAAPWKPGRLFNPFIIDHGTIAWNVFHARNLEGYIPVFHRLWHHFAHGQELPHEDQRFWDQYFQSWKYSRFLSRGGNPHWEIEESPQPGEIMAPQGGPV